MKYQPFCLCFNAASYKMRLNLTIPIGFWEDSPGCPCKTEKHWSNKHLHQKCLSLLLLSSKEMKY